MSDARRTRGRRVSIRTRLTVWYSASVALALAVFAVVVYVAMWRSLESELDKKLVEGATFHTERLVHQFSEETIDHALESVVRKNPFRSLDIEIYGPSGERLVASADLGPQAVATPADLARVPMRGVTLVRGRSSSPDFGP